MNINTDPASLYQLSFAADAVPGLMVACVTGANGLTLFPYQAAALAQRSMRKHIYLGHHPGKGKTAIVLMMARDIPPSELVVVVCPPAVAKQWQRAAADWLGESWKIVATGAVLDKLTATPRINDGRSARWIIPDTIIHMGTPRPTAMFVWDEAHRGKTRDARRTRAVYGGRNAPSWAQMTHQFVAMSGTPMPNCSVELYPFLHAMTPIIAPDFKTFTDKYCPPESIYIAGREILTYRTSVNRSELAKRLRSTSLIRPVKDAMDNQLPALREESVNVTINHTSCFLTQDAMLRLASGVGTDAERLAFSTLRREVGVAKATQAMGYLETLVDGGHRPMIVCHHRDIAHGIAEALKLPALTGDRGVDERSADIAEFIAGRHRGVVGTIGACGTGTDGLQHATDCIVFVERSFVPMEMEQTIGRLHRTGQKRGVRVIYLHAQDTLDYAIDAALHMKSEAVSEVVG